MRKYFWNIDIIDILADIETKAYTAFPDIDSLIRSLKNLKVSVHSTVLKYCDTRLDKSIDTFIDELESSDNEIYIPIRVITEVKSFHEDNSVE